MDDLKFGARNKRGDWTPSAYLDDRSRLRAAASASRLPEMASRLFSPWNLLFAASAVAYAMFVLPDVEVMKTLAWGWILRLFIVNCIAVVPVLQRLRVPALYVPGAREPLQVPRQISQRPEEQRLPVPEPERRGNHPGIWNGRADLDGL